MTTFLVNPRSGGGRAVRRLFRAIAPEELRQWGQVFLCQERNALGELIASTVNQGCERLVVVGGDGTFHQVVNALYRTGALGAVTLGLVPAGTGSDLARGLGLPRRIPEAVKLAVEGLPRLTDVGVLQRGREELLFCNVASLGISGLVDERVNAQTRRGATAFFRATLAALWAFQPVQGKVLVDEEELYVGPLLLAAVANGQYFGKGMHIAPRAHPADEVLDVVVVEPLPSAQLLARLPLLYLGRHLGLPQVHSKKGKVVRLEVEGSLPPLDVDGECYQAGSAVLRLLPKALRIAGG